MSVEILNGNGIYTLVGGTDNVTSTINGNSLVVTGTNEGTTTVHVTDTNTGSTAVLTVIVINPNVVDGHEYVDLGLPSGTLWATCNVGADIPEEYGDYFAWGETSPKDVLYDWTTYIWCNGSYNTMTKYCTNSDYGFKGFTDGKTELDPEDDAAYVNWGPGWRMPSADQVNELFTQCTWTWTQLNGVNGRMVTGPNGNTIFLPAAGYQWPSLLNVGSRGIYRSRTLAPSSINPYGISFSSESFAWDSSNRPLGSTIRAVRISQN